MAKKNVSDRDYLFLSSMLKARENRMLRRDRLEQMLSSGSFEEAARLLAEIGWPDMTGMGSAAVSEALAGRQAEIYAEITRFVPEKELVGIFRLKYDYHNAKTIVKGEGAGVDAAYLLSDAGQIEPEKLEAAFREDSFRSVPGKLGPAMAEAKGILARTGNPQLADFALDKAYYEDLKALADAISSPFVKGYVTTLIDSANLRAAVRCVRMGKDAEFLRGALVAGGNVPVQRLVQAVFSGEGIAAAFAATPFRDAAALGAAAIEGGTMTEFERECDNAVNRYVTGAHLKSFGPEQVVGYLTAEEGNTMAVRMVLTGLLAGIAPERLKERLRERYV